MKGNFKKEEEKEEIGKSSYNKLEHGIPIYACHTIPLVCKIRLPKHVSQ